MSRESGSLKIYQNTLPGGVFPLGHIKPVWPDHYALIWFKGGGGRYFVDFKEYHFQPDTLIVISQNQDLSFEFSEENHDFRIFTFPADFVARSEQKVQKLLSFCIREHFQGKQILKLSEKNAHYLEELSLQLSNILNNWQGELKRESSYHFFQLFLLYCAHLSTEQAAEETLVHDQVVSQFTSLLEQDFRHTHKVSHYTEHLNLTYNSLARFTGHYCDKSPKELITERVVLEIKRRLASTSQPVKEIAYDLGFDEPTNLVKFFKKNTGSTPSTFRQQREFSPLEE